MPIISNFPSGDNGITLNSLSNPAISEDITYRKEAYNQNGEKIIGNNMNGSKTNEVIVLNMTSVNIIVECKDRNKNSLSLLCPPSSSQESCLTLTTISSWYDVCSTLTVHTENYEPGIMQVVIKPHNKYPTNVLVIVV